MSQQKDPLSSKCSPTANALPETNLGQWEQAPATPDLTGAERRLVEIAVGHVLKHLDWSLQQYLRDECESEALIEILHLRPALAQRPEAERAPYAMASLCHKLSRWLKRELAQRQQVDPVQPAVSEEALPPEPADERETDWDNRIARSLLEDVRDEQLALALRTLPPLTQQILDLRYFCDLPDRAIAARLKARVKAVQRRRERGIEKLQESLGVRQAKQVSLSRRRTV